MTPWAESPCKDDHDVMVLNDAPPLRSHGGKDRLPAAVQ